MKQDICPISIVTYCSSVRDLQQHIWDSFYINHPVLPKATIFSKE